MMKAKGILAAVCALTLAVGGTSLTTGCIKKKANDPNVLNVLCYNNGYGIQWMREIIDKFEAENTGYTVNLTAPEGDAVKGMISKNIKSKDNTDDLYISVGAEWKSYAARGQFAALDDLLDETVDGIAFKDKINPEYAQSVYYKTSSGETRTYRLPWTSGVGGIYYNAKMFEDNGWTPPETYEDLVKLCGDIVAAKVKVAGEDGKTYVKPFIYSDQNPDYFDYAVYTWWGQLAGKDAVTEFLKYDSADNFDTAKNPTYAKLKTATQLWQNLFTQSSYVAKGSDKDSTQQSFVNGYAAMMINGDWLYNETLNYGSPSDFPNFKLAVMNTPAAPNAIEPGLSYVIGEDQYIAVPAGSIKQDLAKKFIKLMVSDFGCKAFSKHASGMLAYQCDYSDVTDASDYVKSLIDYQNATTSAFTNFSSNLLYLTNTVDIWATGGLRPYDNIMKGTSTLDAAFTTIADETSRQWDTWKGQAGIK